MKPLLPFPITADNLTPSTPSAVWQGSNCRSRSIRESARLAICPQRPVLGPKCWGQIVDEALLPFRITADNLTTATPPRHRQYPPGRRLRRLPLQRPQENPPAQIQTRHGSKNRRSRIRVPRAAKKRTGGGYAVRPSARTVSVVFFWLGRDPAYMTAGPLKGAVGVGSAESPSAENLRTF